MRLTNRSSGIKVESPYVHQSLDDLKWNLNGLKRVLETGKTGRGVAISDSDRLRLQKQVEEIEAELKTRGTNTV